MPESLQFMMRLLLLIAHLNTVTTQLIRPTLTLLSSPYAHRLMARNVETSKDLTVVQNASQGKVPFETHRILLRTIFPRGNCLSCESATDKQSRKSGQTRSRQTSPPVVARGPTGQLSELPSQPSIHETRRISPPWPSLTRVAGTTDRFHHSNPNQNTDWYQTSHQSSTQQSGQRSMSSHTGSSHHASSSKREHGGGASTSAPSYERQSRNPSPSSSSSKLTSHSHPSSMRDSRSSSPGRELPGLGRADRPVEISATMKGPGYIHILKGPYIDQGIRYPSIHYKVQKDEVMQRTWSHSADLSAHFMTGKRGEYSLSGLGKTIDISAQQTHSSSSRSRRHPSTARLQTWEPSSGKMLQSAAENNPVGARPGKTQTVLLPNPNPSQQRDLVEASASSKDDQPVGMCASARGSVQTWVLCRNYSMDELDEKLDPWRST